MTEGNSVPRVALRWPDEAAKALGLSPLELTGSELARHVRVWTVGRVQLVAVAELERFLNPPVEQDES